jgi:hypothetical protein
MARYLALAAAELVIVSLAVLALVLVLRTPGQAPMHAHLMPDTIHAGHPVRP